MAGEGGRGSIGSERSRNKWELCANNLRHFGARMNCGSPGVYVICAFRTNFSLFSICMRTDAIGAPCVYVATRMRNILTPLEA